MQDATRAQLCLTRLCEVTTPQLLLQLSPVVLRTSCCGAREPRSLAVAWVGEESDYVKAYGYLRRHAGWMDYSRYCQLRTPIGSGVTEAPARSCSLSVSSEQA
jgi:hypothetical protein